MLSANCSKRARFSGTYVVYGAGTRPGLRRLLLDSEGKPKVILNDGQEKHLASDRVTYTLGPPEEIAIVRDIFSMFLEQDLAPYRIVRILN